MHRIDTEGHADGLWQDGNPQIGQQGTIVSADWLNDTQENLVGVVEAAGLELDKGDYDQLRLAIQTLIDTAVAAGVAAARTRAGKVEQFDGPVPAVSHLPLDGSEYLRADYPELVAFYEGQGRLIAGSTGAHFKTPDYRGRFARATSADATVDKGGPRAPGSLQAQSIETHKHRITTDSNDNSGSGYTADSVGTGFKNQAWTDDAGGDETRPVNVAFAWAVTTGRLA